MTDVKRTLRVPVKVKESGRSRKISTQEGALMLLREKALQGDARALDRLLELARLFNNDAVPALSSDDRAILDAYAAEIAATSKHKQRSVSAVKQRVPIPTRAWSLPMKDAAVLAALLRSDLRFWKSFQTIPPGSRRHRPPPDACARR